TISASDKISDASQLWGIFAFEGMILKLEFFTVDDEYIVHLKHHDNKVPNNYAMGKPFIGILFSINDVDYIAPLTSVKEKHNKIKNSNPTSFKVFDGVENPRLISVVQLNNMIPVNQSVITKFNLEAYDIKYQFLVNKELNYIRANSESLIKKAKKLYSIVVNKKVDSLVSISCDFKKLENAMSDYFL
ncbi:type III toxin-antitoxin system ToxN/AbiQ family toxin, partial [Pectobacterium versatile]|uniref:type III toxin-antitoxin system ToxN/AbiQ family toxin n=1 Tax=Pectobacterium versatile TaxID=2488639 RepID=UPI0020BDF049